MPVPVPVTIESEHDSIGGGLEPLVFTLTRVGSTAGALNATVTIVQDEAWLGASGLTHTVHFDPDKHTTTLTIAARRFSFDPVTRGNLTATVSGTGISGGSDSVEVVSTPDPPITIGYDKPEYSFAEDATDAALHAVATLNPAYPRAPSFTFDLTFPARSDTAVSPEDYPAVSWQQAFANADFELENGLFVARKPVSGFAIENDDIYEGSERFDMTIDAAPGLRDGLVQFADPDGATCVPGDCSPVPAYPVTITDEEDQPVLSLSAVPPSIAEEDDGGTAGIAENVSTLTVQITNGKTFAENRTVTLAFSGTAVEGTHYEVSPDDAEPAAAGHQLVVPGETASVQATVTAMANASADGDRTVAVDADLGGADIGSRTITIVDDEVTTTNTAATGTPTITGVPQVGEVLTAGIGNIADADDLPGAFPDDYIFQWVRVDSSANETYVGTNSSSYSPTSADVGSTLRVGVSFTDDAGNPEGPLPSGAVGPVPVPVTIESEYVSIGGGLEPLVFTLTRDGSTEDELNATVTIDQDQAWLGASRPLAHLDLRGGQRHRDADDRGGQVLVRPRHQRQPHRHGVGDRHLGRLRQGGDRLDSGSADHGRLRQARIHLRGECPQGGPDHLRGADTRPGLCPSAVVYVRSHLFVGGRIRPAVPTTTPRSVRNNDFHGNDFKREDDRLVARVPIVGVSIENDDIYEGSEPEHFNMVIEQSRRHLELPGAVRRSRGRHVQTILRLSAASRAIPRVHHRRGGPAGAVAVGRPLVDRRGGRKRDRGHRRERVRPDGGRSPTARPSPRIKRSRSPSPVPPSRARTTR